jgi:DNA-binding phage protein
MPLTRNSTETIIERIQREPEFAKALLEEAYFLMCNGEPETARLVLRDLVNGTIGFEKLASHTSIHSKSLHRMLSVKGNPTMENLNAILRVLCQHLQVNIEVRTVSFN